MLRKRLNNLHETENLIAENNESEISGLLESLRKCVLPRDHAEVLKIFKETVELRRSNGLNFSTNVLFDLFLVSPDLVGINELII